MSEYLPKPVWLLWRERAEAAEARIAELEAELSKVRAERDKSRDDLHATMAKVLDGYRELALRLSAAEAELAKARAAIQSMSAVLSQIDYLCGEPNDMHVSGYDVHCDEEAVLRHVKHRLAELDEFVRLRQGGNQDD